MTHHTLATRPTSTPSPRILFTGYAPVHFYCFQPLYERLTAAGMSVSVSGGLRTKANGTTHYDEAALYGPLGLPAGAVLPVEELGEHDFDLVFAANTKMILPRSAGARIQIFHGISFRNKAIRPQNASADYYFVVGPYMRRRFAETGLIPGRSCCMRPPGRNTTHSRRWAKRSFVASPGAVGTTC